MFAHLLVGGSTTVINRTFRPAAALPRLTAAVAALAVAGLPTAAAHADGQDGRGSRAGQGSGRAHAAVLRTDLDVSLLNKTVDVPLSLTLNDVSAPASARETALEARLDGVDGGRPFSVLRADVATAEATTSASAAEGNTRIAGAALRLPGLPGLPLLKAQEVTARAYCPAAGRPRAESNVLGSVTVLGKRITLSAGGTTRVAVPGVGDVSLALSARDTTSRTAAATALRLQVSVNPLKLNVADVKGTVTLATADCHSPAPAKAGHDPQPAGSTPPSAPPAAHAAQERPPKLAETGQSAATPYLVGGGGVLLLAGGTAFALARRRRQG
ncbi:SCO1860 family LAETG-anchored protein [Streptomyces sp. NPDC050560]|uniref:SCO1860 family LAETG-anchored protein n=1 Tax=Streptomyces sp. NPDC050560 TaxID=3365630 RepID=UPI0037AB7BF7